MCSAKNFKKMYREWGWNKEALKAPRWSAKQAAPTETMLIKQKQSENILKKPVLPVIDIKRYIQSSSEFRISR